jgi:hypothetical protein
MLAFPMLAWGVIVSGGCGVGVRVGGEALGV